MKKYYFLIKNELQRQFAYRIEIWAYRIGNLLEVLAMIFVWHIAYQSTDNIAGYSYSQMTSYVLIGWLFVYLTGNYGLKERIADDIFEGRVSDFLIKPMSYLRHITALSIGRSSVSLLSAVLVQIIIIAIFSKNIVFNLDFTRGTLLFLMLGASFVFNLFMAMAIGMIAFWTQRITGLDYSLYVVMKFLSGAFFPIALLPESFLNFDKIFPFIYTFYIPTEVYLGKISTEKGFIGLGIEIIWIFVFYGIIKIMWKRGIKKYEGVGI